jgi:hypothetical protein
MSKLDPNPNPDIHSLAAAPVDRSCISAEALSLWQEAIEQERKRAIFRVPSEDTIPLRLEEFEATLLEREFWKRATPLCRQTRDPYSDRIHSEGFEIELHCLRVANGLLIGVAEVRIQRQYQNLDYLGLRLSGTIILESFQSLKTVTRSGLRSKYLERGTRPKWLVPDFKLPDGSDQLAEVLKQAFVPPKGSRLTASDASRSSKILSEPGKRKTWNGQGRS